MLRKYRATWYPIVGLLLVLVPFQIEPIRSGLLMNFISVPVMRVWLQESDISATPCESGRYATAVDTQRLRSLVTKLDSTNLRAQILDARVKMIDGDCAGATRTWRRLIDQEVEHPAVLAVALLHEDWYRFLDADTRALLGDFALMKAAKLHDGRDFQSARIWYERAFRLHPTWRSARALVGLYSAIGQAESAKSVWTSLFEEASPESEDYWWAKAELDAMKGDWLSAGTGFEKGASVSLYSFDFLLRAGQAWHAAGKYEEAQQAYLRASEILPTNSRPFLALGDAEAARGQYQAAIKWYMKGALVDPNNPVFPQVLAQTYYQLGERSLAERYLGVALKISPHHPWSLYLLAHVTADKGDINSALHLAIQAIEAYPSPSKPTDWVRQSIEWALKLKSCRAAHYLMGFIEVSQLKPNVLETYHVACAG